MPPPPDEPPDDPPLDPPEEPPLDPPEEPPLEPPEEPPLEPLDPLDPLEPLEPPLGGGIPPPEDGIPPPDAPPDELLLVLQAPVTSAANAMNISGLIQLGTNVRERRDVIVLTLCNARTPRVLEHQRRG